MFNTINCIFNYILLSFTTNSNFIRYVCSKRGDNLLKRYVLIFALILLTVTTFAKPESGYRSRVLPDSKEKTESSVRADSIMKEVIKNADKYQHILSKYEAEIYIKGTYGDTQTQLSATVRPPSLSCRQEKQRHDLRDGKQLQVHRPEQFPA